MEYLTITEAALCHDHIYPSLQAAVNHAVEKNWSLYMTYDNSVERKCGSIPANMFTNAIIDLSHKENIPDHNYYAKSKDWASYYSNASWEPILSYIKDNLQDVIYQTLKYNVEKDSAFPDDSNFINALCHCAWIFVYY